MVLTRQRKDIVMSRSRIVATVVRVAIIAAVASPSVCLALTDDRPAQTAAEPASQQELAKKIVNPLTDMVSVPLQFNWMNGVGPDKELRSLTYFQPVVPMSMSEHWNLIGRWVVPYLSQPAAFGGSSGISDIIAQAFFSPKASGTFTWGVGPMVYMPTTNNPTLGYGKWSAGPVVAVMKQRGGLTYGMLANNIWSFASTGTAERPDVNMGYFQPVLAYSTHAGVTMSFGTETIADWNAKKADDRWSVPITAAVSKIVRFGPNPMSVQVGAGYYVAKPTYGPSWQLRTTFTLLMPRAR
jgi:hypothetical protein